MEMVIWLEMTKYIILDSIEIKRLIVSVHITWFIWIFFVIVQHKPTLKSVRDGDDIEGKVQGQTYHGVPPASSRRSHHNSGAAERMLRHRVRRRRRWFHDVTMSKVLFVDQDEHKTHMESFFVQGSLIRYVQIPDDIDMVKVMQHEVRNLNPKIGHPGSMTGRKFKQPLKLHDGWTLESWEVERKRKFFFLKFQKLLRDASSEDQLSCLRN